MTDEQLFLTLPEVSEEMRRRVELDFAHYIWYESGKTRGHRRYTCSCCHESWRADELRVETAADDALYCANHGDIVECPRCGETAKMMCLGRISAGWRYSQSFGVSIVIAAEGNPSEVWIRTYNVWKTYGSYSGKGVYYNAKAKWEEMARHRMVPGEAQYWSRGYYSTGMSREKKVADRYNSRNWGNVHGGCATGIYFQTLLEDTFLRYCAWNAYDRKCTTSPVKYLCAYAKYPQIEMMVKMGYQDQVRELVMDGKKNAKYIDWNKSKPWDIFRMSRTDFAEWKRRGGDFYLRKIWGRYKDHGKRWAAAQEEYDTIKHDYRMGDPFVIGVARGAARDFHTAAVYAQKMRDAHGYGWFSKWKDYCMAAACMGDALDDPKRAFPADLLAAHDDMMARKAEIDAQALYKRQTVHQAGLEKHLPQYRKKYTASDGVYMIRVPETTAEIVKEGNMLDHCVGRMEYIKNMANGGNAIVFLRRCDAPDKPWFTIEVSKNKILQCEGARRHDGQIGYHGHLYRDDLPEDAKEFLDAWESKVCGIKQKNDHKEIA